MTASIMTGAVVVVSLTSDIAVDCTRLATEVGTVVGFLAHVDADPVERFSSATSGVPSAVMNDVSAATVLEVVDVTFGPMARNGATTVDDAAAGVHLIDMLQQPS